MSDHLKFLCSILKTAILANKPLTVEEMKAALAHVHGPVANGGGGGGPNEPL